MWKIKIDGNKTPYQDLTRIKIKMNQIVPTDNENILQMWTQR